MLHASLDWSYKFSTEKYYVFVSNICTAAGSSRVESKEVRLVCENYIAIPFINTHIPKALSPKTNDADIEKYLMLL